MLSSPVISWFHLRPTAGIDHHCLGSLSTSDHCRTTRSLELPLSFSRTELAWPLLYLL